MQVLVFDIRGTLAHFRMPDTLNTHASYPFIPPTTLRGLVGSMLGMPEFEGHALAGIRIMSPVRKSVQQMSMLGKGWLGSGEFNRPTTIELIVQPHYRIYWTGDYLDALIELLMSGRSHYHSYLGSAFALTFPRYIGTYDCESLDERCDGALECITVVPVDAIQHLYLKPESQYSRISGLHSEYLGNRRFGKTRNVLYEPLGNSILLKPNRQIDGGPTCFCSTKNGEHVCLW